MSHSETSIFKLLRERYHKDRYALLPQVADRTGRPTRFADAVAMSLWPSRGLALEGFEIKVDRRDWLRELENHAKAEAIYAFMDLWWIVAPTGIVRDGELPPTWGLLEVVQQADKSYKVRESVKAPKNPDALAPTRPFIASLLRSLQAHETPEADLAVAHEDMRRTVAAEATKAAQVSIKMQTEKLREELDRCRKSLNTFERAAGINIDTWSIANAEVMGKRFKAMKANAEALERTTASLQATHAQAERLLQTTATLLKEFA